MVKRVAGLLAVPTGGVKEVNSVFIIFVVNSNDLAIGEVKIFENFS